MKLRYIVAQVVILAIWALDWIRRGAYYGQQPDGFFSSMLGSFIVIFFLMAMWLPTIVIVMIDGFAGRSREGPIRRIVLSVLVVGFALLLVNVGNLSLVFEDLLGTHLPSALGRVTSLIAVETIFLLEWVVAALIRQRHGR